MAYNGRKLVISGVIGSLTALLIISTIIGTGILPVLPPSPPLEGKGLLVIKVKDAPAKELKGLLLEIGNPIRVHKEGEGEGTWMEVSLFSDLEQPFDLLKLEDISMVLAVGELSVGSYTEIRLDITEARAIIAENDGISEIPLRIVANGQLMMKIHFTIEEESVTSITVDINVNPNPIVNAGILHPVAKATVDYSEEAGPELVQNHYRWAENDKKETPTFRDDEDTPISDVALTGEILRLRLSIINIGTAAWSNAQLKLQYTTNPDGTWHDVRAQGTVWLYYDGEGEDKARVGPLFLAGSTVREYLVESAPTEIIKEIPVNGQGEWDICIVSNGALPGTTYFFRFVLSDGTPLDEYTVYPTLTTTIISQES